MQHRCARSTAIVAITVVAQLFASRSQAGMAPAAQEPTAAAATDPASTDADVAMVINVETKLGEQDAFVGPQLRAGVRERLTTLRLREQAAASRELTIIVRWADHDGQPAPDVYAIDYELATSAAPGQPRALLSTECERCGLSDLLDAIERDIGKLRPQLTAPVEVPTVEPPPPVVSSSPQPPDDGAKRRRAPLSTVGKAGVGLTASGGVGLIAGAVLLAIPTKERVPPDEYEIIETTSYRKPGIATLSIGAALLVAGIVMVAVDRTRARRGDPTRSAMRRGMMLGVLR